VTASVSTALSVGGDGECLNVVRVLCEAQGLSVVEATTGREAISIAQAVAPDIVLLDLALPDAAGYDVCRHLRADGLTVPILAISGHADLVEAVLTLELGADDYIRKPLPFKEFHARLRAHLRRTQPPRPALPATRLDFPGLSIDMARRETLCDGDVVPLTVTEFNLLSVLAANAGLVVPRSELMLQVWGADASIDPRTVDAHVFRLRRKIEPFRENRRQPGRYIQSVASIGYRFAEEPMAA